MEEEGAEGTSEEGVWTEVEEEDSEEAEETLEEVVVETLEEEVEETSVVGVGTFVAVVVVHLAQVEVEEEEAVVGVTERDLHMEEREQGGMRAGAPLPPLTAEVKVGNMEIGAMRGEAPHRSGRVMEHRRQEKVTPAPPPETATELQPPERVM